MAVDPDVDGFVEELATLKRNGCTLLVVDPFEDAALCEELLGHPDEPRYRIVVDAGDHAPTHLEDGEVVEAGEHFTRSAAASSPSADAGPRDLASVFESIESRVARFERDGLRPGELRVCMGEITSLAIGSDPGTLLSFLEDVGDIVRGASGMGHLHATPDAASREHVEALFDVTVQARRTSRGREYRWHLHDADLDSGWIALDQA